METLLFPLRSAIATWQCCSPCWVIDVILGIVCGVLLFLVLIHGSESDGPSPPLRDHGHTRQVRIPWPRLNRDGLFSILIPTFLNDLGRLLQWEERATAPRKEQNLILLGTSQVAQELEQAGGFLCRDLQPGGQVWWGL